MGLTMPSACGPGTQDERARPASARRRIGGAKSAAAEDPTTAQHLLGHRPVRILPILVTGSWIGESDEQGAGLIRRAMDALRALVDESGSKAFWLVSGDLAHVGRKFGDTADADAIINDVRSADAILLEHLQEVDQNVRVVGGP